MKIIINVQGRNILHQNITLKKHDKEVTKQNCKIE